MKRLFLAAVVAGLMLVPASSASAFTGEYARFNTCPLSNASVTFCLSAESTGGQFTVGKKTVPLVNQVNLRGGLIAPEGLAGPATFTAPTDGVVLSKAAQPVPGGLTGIVAPSWWPQILRDLFNETINNGFTGVTATVELAGSASSVKISFINALFQSGTAIGLPVKVKLSNPFLGSNCYIGSNSNPVQLNLTTGTTSPPPPNTPISGTPGEFGNIEEKILFLKKNKLVDNSFAAPGANGCGGILFSWAVDPFVNSIVGVPSPAGTNTAILEGTTYLGNGEALRAM
ncbi:MAG TPA: hypothetical protein VNC16_07860 [Solirubrobacterales bacterium]|jgi:hypothetical protein|nr:hypothetical protein [Solirubrobacterales bacterium]